MRCPSPVVRSLAWLALLLMLLAGWPGSARAEVQTFHSALAADGGTVPPDDAWTAVALPDDWVRSPPRAGVTRWYRISFEAAPTDSLLALHIERVCTDFEVWLNGRLAHRDGTMNAANAHQCSHPRLLTLSPELLRAGTNRLELRVAGHRLAEVAARQRVGGLGAVHVAPHESLAWRQALRHTVAVELPMALSATLLLLGGYLFVLGYVHRRESHLAYFGALGVGWALAHSALWLHAAPFAAAVAEFLLATLAAFLTLAAVQFLLRAAGLRFALADRGLPLQCALMPLTLVAAGPEQLYPVAAAWYVLLALQVAAAALVHLRQRTRGPRTARRSTTALLAVGVLAGVGQAAMQLEGSSGPLALASGLAQLALAATMAFTGLRLVQQHGQTMQETVYGKAIFEERLREATAELERDFRQLADLRVEQVTERERKRIAADLHDDLGAKLLTIVHTSESDRISSLAREALEEMRLSVRGLTGRPVRLADALGDWRAEVVSRLAQAGIGADWQAPEDLPQMLTARAYVQTTRILREATSNAIKHSGASHCDIECSVTDGDLLIVIRDDGAGISMELDGRLDRGHGMATMKQRAKQLQGQCLVESGPGYGTVIRLTIPLDRAVEPT